MTTSLQSASSRPTGGESSRLKLWGAGRTGLTASWLTQAAHLTVALSRGAAGACRIALLHQVWLLCRIGDSHAMW